MLVAHKIYNANVVSCLENKLKVRLDLGFLFVERIINVNKIIVPSDYIDNEIEFLSIYTPKYFTAKCGLMKRILVQILNKDDDGYLVELIVKRHNGSLVHAFGRISR